MSSQQPNTISSDEFSSGEQRSAAPPSVGAVILAIVLTALMLAGFYVMGIAFRTEGWELLTFLGGMLLAVFPFFVVFSWLSDGTD